MRVLAALLVACSGQPADATSTGSAPPVPADAVAIDADDGRAAVLKMREFKDAMCKCGAGKRDCAQKVVDDQKKYADEMAKTADKNAAVVPGLREAMQPIVTEYEKCAVKAMLGVQTVEGATTVFTVEDPVFCFKEKTGSRCTRHKNECDQVRSTSKLAAGDCVSRDSMACTEIREVMRGEQWLHCTPDMSGCKEAQRASYRMENFSAGECFVVRQKK